MIEVKSYDGYRAAPPILQGWEAINSQFGSRHLQYERFYVGEPATIAGREYRNFDWNGAAALVDRCWAGYDLGAIKAS